MASSPGRKRKAEELKPTIWSPAPKERSTGEAIVQGPLMSFLGVTQGREGLPLPEGEAEAEGFAALKKKEKEVGWDGDFGRYMEEKIRKLKEQYRADSKDALFEAAARESVRSELGPTGRNELFRGVSIWVNGFTIPSHQELRHLMLCHGGTFENYYSNKRVTHIICANLPDSKYLDYRTKTKLPPILRPEWVTASIEAERLLPLGPFKLLRLAYDHPGQSTLHEFLPPPLPSCLCPLDERSSPTQADGREGCGGGPSPDAAGKHTLMPATCCALASEPPNAVEAAFIGREKPPAAEPGLCRPRQVSPQGQINKGSGDGGAEEASCAVRSRQVALPGRAAVGPFSGPSFGQAAGAAVGAEATAFEAEDGRVVGKALPVAQVADGSAGSCQEPWDEPQPSGSRCREEEWGSKGGAEEPLRGAVQSSVAVPEWETVVLAPEEAGASGFASPPPSGLLLPPPEGPGVPITQSVGGGERGGELSTGEQERSVAGDHSSADGGIVSTAARSLIAAHMTGALGQGTDLGERWAGDSEGTECSGFQQLAAASGEEEPLPNSRQGHVARSETFTEGGTVMLVGAGGGGTAGGSPPALGPPGRRLHNTMDDPDFIQNYYKYSRLHYIGTWRNRYQGQAKDPSSHHPKAEARPLGLGGRGAAETAGERAVIHVDMDCFFVSVAMRNRPELRGRPVAVCHSNSARGTAEISSANYEARKFGVRNGTFMRAAKAKCPDLVTLPYDFEAYERVADQVYAILHRHSNVVQALSCDEAYIDVTGRGDPAAIAATIRAEIEGATGCTASAGIAHNLLLARLATRKAKPNGQLHILPFEALHFVAELPVADLHGVGWALREKLHERSLLTCAQLRAVPREALQRDFGAKTGGMLWAAARGADGRSVRPAGPRKSIGAEVNWGVRFATHADADDFVGKLAAEVCGRLRAAGVRGRTFTLKVKRRRADAPAEPFKFMGCGPCDEFSRSASVGAATDDTAAAARVARRLYAALGAAATGEPCDVRGVGLQVARLEPAAAVVAAEPHSVAGLFRGAVARENPPLGSAGGCLRAAEEAPAQEQGGNRVAIAGRAAEEENRPARYVAAAGEEEAVRGSCGPKQYAEVGARGGGSCSGGKALPPRVGEVAFTSCQLAAGCGARERDRCAFKSFAAFPAVECGERAGRGEEVDKVSSGKRTVEDIPALDHCTGVPSAPSPFKESEVLPGLQQAVAPRSQLDPAVLAELPLEILSELQVAIAGRISPPSPLAHQVQPLAQLLPGGKLCASKTSLEGGNEKEGVEEGPYGAPSVPHVQSERQVSGGKPGKAETEACAPVASGACNSELLPPHGSYCSPPGSGRGGPTTARQVALSAVCADEDSASLSARDASLNGSVGQGTVPPADQLDQRVLDALPLVVRREIERAYETQKHVAAAGQDVCSSLSGGQPPASRQGPSTRVRKRGGGGGRRRASPLRTRLGAHPGSAQTAGSAGTPSGSVTGTASLGGGHAEHPSPGSRSVDMAQEKPSQRQVARVYPLSQRSLGAIRGKLPFLPAQPPSIASVAPDEEDRVGGGTASAARPAGAPIGGTELRERLSLEVGAAVAVAPQRKKVLATEGSGNTGACHLDGPAGGGPPEGKDTRQVGTGLDSGQLVGLQVLTRQGLPSQGLWEGAPPLWTALCRSSGAGRAPSCPPLRQLAKAYLLEASQQQRQRRQCGSRLEGQQAVKLSLVIRKVGSRVEPRVRGAGRLAAEELCTRVLLQYVVAAAAEDLEEVQALLRALRWQSEERRFWRKVADLATPLIQEAIHGRFGGFLPV